MSLAVAGVGTQFRRWSGSAWAAIAEVNGITGPTKSRDTIDVTSLDSTGGYREFIPGFRDGGTVTLPMNFTRDTYDLMNTDYEADTIQNYQILLSDPENTGFDFEGFVTELGLAVPVDDKISADVTIKITGQIVTSSGGSTGV